VSWSDRHAQLHRTLGQRQLLPRGARILVAVSGGQDSLCLIQLLRDLASHWDWTLAVAHCDHGWRADSAANADYVRSLTEGWHLPFYLRVADRAPSSEAAARAWRYEALTDIAIENGYDTVATGHTATDRAETLLYNLVRGSGADGLQSLVWQRPLGEIALVRPLLDWGRGETRDFCRSAGLAIWADATNADPQYDRNYIRHEIMPLLQSRLNPQAEQHLAQTAELLTAEVAYLEALATDLLAQLVGADPMRIDRGGLRAAPLALQRRVLRRFLRDALGIAPNFAQIEKLVALLEAPQRAATDPLTGGAIAVVDGTWLSLVGQNRSEPGI
jgi:tRNA(Ile)-lysidine synthase